MKSIPNLEYYNRLLEGLQNEKNTSLNEHDYNMAALGNWYIIYNQKNLNFKIRWDGKTKRLYHQFETDEIWLNQNIYQDLSTLIENELPTVEDYLEKILKVEIDQ